MAYVGNTVTTQGFIPAIDYFNGDGTTTAFTLSRPVASVAQVQVVVNNVPQLPGTAYTVSGSTITFTGAPSAGTSNIYVYYTSPITQVIAPSQGTVSSTSFASSTGSGAVVLATSPALVTPALGTPSAINLSNATALPKAALPTGSVLQVVQASTNSTISTTSTTFTGSGLTASITPTSSTSKILVGLSGGQWRFVSSGSTGEGWVQLWKSVGGGAYAAVNSFGGSDIQEILINYTNSTIGIPHSLQYLDSPATTSAIIYQPYFKTTSAGITVNYNLSSVITYITLMEIAG